MTTARYYTPSGKSIQGKGIEPDIVIEQGIFESNEFKRLSESDLKDSLDKKNNMEENIINEDNNLKEERLKIDFQLNRAIDLLKGIHVYEQSLIK